MFILFLLGVSRSAHQLFEISKVLLSKQEMLRACSRDELSRPEGVGLARLGTKLGPKLFTRLRLVQGTMNLLLMHAPHRRNLDNGEPCF